MTIRPERESDVEAISEVTQAAFETHPHSHQTEHFIVQALRAAKALSVSLVAEVDGRVVGHLAFSPATISDRSAGWYGVGPVSVTPEFQKQGIGKALVKEGLSLLKSSGGKGCVLVGDPRFYERFGFRNIPNLIFEGVPAEYFLALPFGREIPQGTVLFHPAFAATS